MVSTEPWVQALRPVIEAIAAHDYPYAFEFNAGRDPPCLLLNVGDIVRFLRRPARIELWDGLPFESDRHLKRELLAVPDLVTVPCVELIFRGLRHGYMVGLSTAVLWRAGLPAAPPPSRFHSPTQREAL